MTGENSAEFSWVTRKRRYDQEKKQLAPNLTTVGPNQHPLKPLVENVSSKATSNTQNKVQLDPLSAGVVDLDPLSQMVANVSLKEKQELIRLNEVKSSFEPWALKKSSILSKYTTVEKLSITSSFLTPIAGAMKDKALNARNMTTVSDKIKTRLEQLDQFDDDNMQEMANLSQQEYIKRIDELNDALQAAWREDDRVKSLKIVIQCSKLLADTSVLQFYPSKFVLITDILDTFGHLVYERIKSKSVYTPPGSSKSQPLPEKFTADIVPSAAKETCRNWFFKIASIRELLPRIYVEASILKCVTFLSDDSIIKSIKRLVGMTGGIGDPLVASFTNCYIFRVGHSIEPSIREYQMLALENTLFVFKQVSPDRVKKLVKNQSVDFKTYLELYSPALDWIFQCVCYSRPAEYLKEIFDKCNQVSTENRIVNGLLINSMMFSFDPAFISSIASNLVEIIRDCDEEYFPKYLLFRNLGACLVFNESSSSQGKAKEKNKQDLQLLNDVWMTVTKFTDPNHYMTCAEIWIEFTLKNFTKKEINKLLGDIIKHILPDRVFEKFYPQLQSIASKILVYVTDFSVLFSMDKFMQFLSLFQKESVKLDVYKSITYAFLRSDQDIYDDILTTNSMMQICKSMHDSINALTLEDEKREISQMICQYINKVEVIEKDKIEQCLSFYSEARASFSNLDPVIALLVHKVNNLANEILRIVNYNHGRKTASFVRACVAYSFITIPSLTNPILKLQLYLESAQLAAKNQCLSQSDAFLKSAISIIPDIQKQLESQSMASLQTSLALDSHAHHLTSKQSQSALSNQSNVERFLNDYLSNMMSTLLVIPDNPEQGVLYLLTGVINLIQKHFVWESTEIKFNLLCNSLVILGALKQDNYLYHMTDGIISSLIGEILFNLFKQIKVESNDTLYGSDSKYFREINTLIDSVLQDLVQTLLTTNPSKQPQLALELLNRLISHADYSDEKTIELAVYLWNISKRGVNVIRFQEQIVNAIRQRANRSQEYRELMLKLGIKQ